MTWEITAIIVISVFFGLVRIVDGRDTIRLNNSRMERWVKKNDLEDAERIESASYVVILDRKNDRLIVGNNVNGKRMTEALSNIKGVTLSEESAGKKTIKNMEFVIHTRNEENPRIVLKLISGEVQIGGMDYDCELAFAQRAAGALESLTK